MTFTKESGGQLLLPSPSEPNANSSPSPVQRRPPSHPADHQKEFGNDDSVGSVVKSILLTHDTAGLNLLNLRKRP